MIKNVEKLPLLTSLFAFFNSFISWIWYKKKYTFSYFGSDSSGSSYRFQELKLDVLLQCFLVNY